MVRARGGRRQEGKVRPRRHQTRRTGRFLPSVRQGGQRPPPSPVTSVKHAQGGNLISMPYFGATASSFSISSLVGGKAVVAPSASGTPTSRNIRSRPAGATDMSI